MDLCVIFLSQTPWVAIRPSLGASPDPYFVDVKPFDKSGMSLRLLT